MPESRFRRWILAIAFTALLGLLVAACGSGDSDNDNSGDKPAKTTTGATGATGNAANATTGQTQPGTGSAVTAGTDPVASGRLFSADSPWNTTAEGLPVADNSDRMLQLATQRRAAKEKPGVEGVDTFTREIVDDGIFVNSKAWAPLIVAANTNGSVPTKFVCRQSKCSSPDPKVPSSLSIPANTTPDPRYDGWLSVIDRENGMGYDFWRARREGDGTISYQFGKAWTLDGPGFSRPVGVDAERAVGARGSGLPLFAGVIGPNELESGEINHALAISVPGLARRNFVQPASVTDGVGDRKSLPAGARIRLRADVSINEKKLRTLKGPRRRSADAILTALRTYGAIVVDRAAVPSLYAPLGTSSKLLRGDELDWLDLDDFEVISLPQIYKDPPLSKVGLEGPETGGQNSQVQSGSAASGNDVGGGL
ncbi:MAG: hypothetical protein J0H66_07425 [Solirubrobacterales bacterium]|nr:hypothetical protein [Solirubrobacterales bacterium]OJU93212.1 MAG: hypothetical protein BGO23_10970 [Solirubrobacterales bacterium 67-14]